MNKSRGSRNDQQRRGLKKQHNGGFGCRVLVVIWKQDKREPGSGTGQSGAGRTSRHEMDYTHSRTKRNTERQAETLVCRHVRATREDKVNLI